MMMMVMMMMMTLMKMMPRSDTADGDRRFRWKMTIGSDNVDDDDNYKWMMVMVEPDNESRSDTADRTWSLVPMDGDDGQWKWIMDL